MSAGPSGEAPGQLEVAEAMWDFTDVGALIPSDGVVVDIGAGVGSFTVAAANRVGPRGVVCCTELNEGRRRLLELSLALNGLERVVRLDGRLIHEAGLRAEAGLTSESIPPDSLTPTSPAPQSIGFDAWADEVGCADGVDFVKVGCDDAHDPAVVIDSNLIEQSQPFIYFHSPAAAPFQGTGYLDTVASYLDGLGYRLVVGKTGRRSANGHQRPQAERDDLSAPEVLHLASAVLAVPAASTTSATEFDTWLAEENSLARVGTGATFAASRPKAPEMRAPTRGVAELEETWN